jgi:hypothetical protein
MKNIFAASALFVFALGLSGQAWASHDDEVVHEDDSDATLHESTPGMRVDVSTPNYVSYRTEETACDTYGVRYDNACRTECDKCGGDYHSMQEGTMPIEWGVVEW